MKSIYGIVLLLLVSGCSNQPSLIIANTSPLPVHVRGDIPAHGVDCQYRLLGLLPVTGVATTHAALQEAKELADTDVLTDVSVDSSSAYYILFSNRCIHVRGLGVARSISNSLHSAARTQFGYLPQ